jgi:hypothetical protein
LIWCALIGLFRSRAALKAENLVLRHQLDVVWRKSPKPHAAHSCDGRLGEEPDPRDLMRPFHAEPMRMWPISTRVNKPENDDPSIVESIELATDAA